MNKLKFRRQFLFSAKKCNQLDIWKFENLGTHFLYVHPDCELTSVRNTDVELFLIGNMINPHFTKKTSLQILNDMSGIKTIDDVPNYLYPLAGRFVLLVKQKEAFTFFHDACGLKQLFYSKDGNGFYAASQPLLLKLVLNIEKNSNYYNYYQSQHVKSIVEHWLPSGVSLYKNVFHLAANHYVDSENTRQVRYWPNKLNEKKDVDESVEKISALLRNTMIAANKRWKLAVSLTAGIDSRLVLSSCRDIIDDAFVYTLQYRNLTEESNDIKIPRKLAKRLRFNYQVIDCRTNFNEDFSDIYVNNSSFSHYNDWGKIANGMYLNYPQERVAVKGNCVEIGRCGYYRSGKHPNISSGKQLLIVADGWDKLEFVNDRLSEWVEEIKDYCGSFGYNMLDLFYWEHRLSSWLSQSQLEWDIVQEAFTPFNNREVIDCMLAVDSKYRCESDSVFFYKILQKLWLEAILEPINPASRLTRIKRKLLKALVHHEIKYKHGTWKLNQIAKTWFPTF